MDFLGSLFQPGQTIEIIFLGVVRDKLPATLIAAMIRPDRSTMGTEMEQIPSSSSWFSALCVFLMLLSFSVRSSAVFDRLTRRIRPWEVH
jgi:hypothetical protein